MYIGSWHTRVQVPNAAALTRPSLSAVVISTRQELGAKMLSHHSGRTSILFVMSRASADSDDESGRGPALKRIADQMVKRDRTAAMDEEIERHNGPHQSVFEPELIPEVFAHPPALDIGHDQEEEDRHGGNACEQTKCEQRAADELRDRDRGRPNPAGAIAVMIELLGKLGEVMGAHARLGKEPEGIAQPVRH